MSRHVTLLAAAALALSLPASEALAQHVRDFGDIADSVRMQTSLVSILLTVIAFVLGVGLAVTGLMKFRQHTQNPNDPSAKPGVAFAFVFAGAAMVALPALISSGVVTVFGSGAGITDAYGGGNVVPFR